MSICTEVNPLKGTQDQDDDRNNEETESRDDPEMEENSDDESTLASRDFSDLITGIKCEPINEPEYELPAEPNWSDNQEDAGSQSAEDENVQNEFVPDSVWSYVNCEWKDEGASDGRRPSKAACKHCPLTWNWPKVERVRAHMQKFHSKELSNDSPTVLPSSGTDSQKKCILCRTNLKTASGRSNENAIRHQSNLTTNSICTVLKLDESFHIYFKKAFYCDSCKKLGDKVGKALKTLHQIQKTLADSRKVIENLLRKNLDTVSTYLDPLRPRRSLKRDSYDEMLKCICAGLPDANKEGSDVDSELRFGDESGAMDSNDEPADTNQYQYPTRRSSRMLPNKKDTSFLYENAISEDEESTVELDDDDFDPSEYLSQEPLEDSSSELEQYDDQDEDYKPSSKSRSKKEKVKHKDRPPAATSSVNARLHCGVPECTFSCLKPNYLQFHIRKVHEKEKYPYFCDLCPKKFGSATSYSYHQRRHTHEPSIACDRCGKLFYERWQLKKHCDSVHQKTGKSKKKPIANQRATAKKDGEQQRKSNEPGKTKYRCTVVDCHFSCFKEAYLKFHVREKHEGDPKPYFCDLCPMTFSSNTSYHYHHKRHTSQPTLTCTYCSKLFYEVWQMKKHIESVHLFQKKFRCQICTYKLDSSNEDELKAHLLLHEERSSSNQYSCVLCDKHDIANYFELKRHVGLEHGSSSENCACPKCDQKFTSPRYLKIHADGMFCEPNPDLKCALCPQFEAKNKTDLLRHVTSHEQDRQFVCEHCGLSFKSSTSLRLHSRIHTGEKPYKCSTCGKAFRLSHLLRNHEEIHLEDKKHECKGCGKKFRAIKNLRQHVNGHCHSEGPKRKQRVRAPKDTEPPLAPAGNEEMECESPSPSPDDVHIEQLPSVLSIPEPQQPPRFQYPPLFGSTALSYGHMYQYQ